MGKLLSLLLLSLAVFAVSASASTVSLTAPLHVSGTFDVAVDVTDVFAPPHDSDFLLAYGFNLSFDNTIVSYLGETPGALFDDFSPLPGAQVAGIAHNIFIAPGDFTEPLNLAVLHFGVVGLGPTTISISGDPSDPSLNQGLVYLTGYDPISASASVTAPEPGSLCLLGLGISALAGRFVRRRIAHAV